MELQKERNTSVYLNIVERNVSALIIYSKVIGCIPILITSPIIGTWSDNYGGFYFAWFFSFAVNEISKKLVACYLIISSNT